ncbi:unnamed protein product [Lactuca saligna]|uniref:Uncharacterized protein n=1 Tax=Lactuca saligna TaxID=75948 RepID=A0AA35YXB2_LACSI|nr:unnamed protein product [Lactuca saligna]
MVHTRSGEDPQEREWTFIHRGNPQPVTMEAIKKIIEELKEEKSQKMNWFLDAHPGEPEQPPMIEDVTPSVAGAPSATSALSAAGCRGCTIFHWCTNNYQPIRTSRVLICCTSSNTLEERMLFQVIYGVQVE